MIVMVAENQSGPGVRLASSAETLGCRVIGMRL